MRAGKRMCERRGQAGFTLIEVLIVVVIIGVLAALVIPRFVTAPEKAMISEANQMLGSLVRAQVGRIDTGTGFVTSAPMNATAWTALGMVAPVSASKFTYACTSPTCQATRTVTLLSTAQYSSATNTWNCTGNYTTLSNGGCSVA